MIRMVKVGALTALCLAAANAGAQATNTDPTCSDVLDIDVHGQHVVGDYVTGTGHSDLDWPPDGGDVGQTVADNGGAVLPGGPGPGFHFDLDIAPGASFCTEGAQSWGVPRGQSSSRLTSRR